MVHFLTTIHSQSGSGATAVTLSSLNARKEANGHITVTWSTGMEIDNEGFNILRSTMPEGGFVRINANLISANGSIGGRSYQYIDITAEAGKEYFYRIQDIDMLGKSSISYLIASTGRRPSVEQAAFTPSATPSLSHDDTQSHVDNTQDALQNNTIYYLSHTPEEITENAPKKGKDTGILSFTVSNKKDGFVIKWRAKDEDITGFNILRSDAPDGQYQPINEGVIKPVEATGKGYYSYKDNSEGSYYYKLEVVKESDVVLIERYTKNND